MRFLLPKKIRLTTIVLCGKSGLINLFVVKSKSSFCVVYFFRTNDPYTFSDQRPFSDQQPFGPTILWTNDPSDQRSTSVFLGYHPSKSQKLCLPTQIVSPSTNKNRVFPDPLFARANFSDNPSVLRSLFRSNRDYIEPRNICGANSQEEKQETCSTNSIVCSLEK